MPVQYHLRKDQFRNFVRMIKQADMERVKTLRTATFNALKRLGAKRQPGRAVAGVPSGSDQVNVRTFTDWLDKVPKDDKAAVRQVVAIDATLVARTA